MHYGSWGHDVGRPKEEVLDGLTARDISYYGNSSLREILDIESPSALLFLSMPIIQMAFNRYAIAKDIPTCHLYHGFVSVQATADGQLSSKPNLIRQLNFVIRRAYKNIVLIIPVYIRALIETRASLDLWFDFAREIIVKVKGRRRAGKVLKGAVTTIGCVYANADVLHMRKNYGIKQEHIYVVGNPDLIYFGVTKEDIGSAWNDFNLNNLVTYVDTCYLDAGAHFASEDDFVAHILSTSMNISSMGLELCVKLHPAHYKTSVPRKIRSNGIKLISNDAFVQTLRKSKFAIVEPSTAALIPGLLGLPIFLAQYGNLRDKQYGEVLMSYPRSQLLVSFSLISELLKTMSDASNRNAFEKWVAQNIGPIPARDMPKRVADILASLCAN